MSDRQWNVAVLGATGLVGDTMIKVLEERKFPVKQLFPLASNRSLGKDVEFNGKKIDLASFVPVAEHEADSKSVYI